MKATWLGVDVARVLHLAGVFCLSCVLLKAIQLYHRRRELLRALAAFPGHPTHWLLGHVHEVCVCGGKMRVGDGPPGGIGVTGEEWGGDPAWGRGDTRGERCQGEPHAAVPAKRGGMQAAAGWGGRRQ